MAKNKQIYLDDEALDLYPGDVKFGLNFHISDIKNLTVRKGSSSSTINLPATSGNKKKFGFLEDWNAINKITQKQKPTAKIESDGTPLMLGFVKADESETNGKITNYSLKVLGDNGDWRERIKYKKLSDLDYSAENHIYNYINIAESWNPALHNYTYDLIDRGQFTGRTSLTASIGTAINIEDCYLAITIKSFVEKIFKAIKYKVVSNFIYGAEFSRLYWAFINKNFKHPDTWKNDKLFRAVKAVSYTLYKPSTWGGTAPISETYPMDWNNDSDTSAFDLSTTFFSPNGLYHNWLNTLPTFKQFRVPTTCKYKFQYKTDYQVWVHQTINSGNSQVNVTFQIVKLGFGKTTEEIINKTEIIFPATSDNTKPVTSIDVTTEFIDLEYGDTVWMQLVLKTPNTNNGGLYSNTHITLLPSAYSFFELLDMQGPYPIHTNQLVTMNENLPDVGQLEFLQALKDSFNLIFYADVATRTIYIEPEDDFYLTTVKPENDWSKTENDWSKVDLNKKIVIENIGDTYSKKMIYQFKEDSNDKFLKEMNEQSDFPFGAKEATIDNQFAKDETLILQNKLFAATWMDFNIGLTGLKTVRLPRMWAGITQPPKSTAFAPRMLYYDGTITLSPSSDSWVLSQEDKMVTVITTALTTTTFYFYPRFYSYGNSAADKNYLYEDTDFASGLWQRFFRNKHKKINDSRLVTLSAYLNDSDISRFDFREPLYIELEGNGAYFEVQEINNYDTDSKESTEIKLIKQVGKVAIASLTTVNKKGAIVTIKLKDRATLVVTTKDNGDKELYMGDFELAKMTPTGGVRAAGGSVYATVKKVNVPVMYRDANNELQKVNLSK